MVLNRAALALLLAGLAGCAGRNVSPLPNPEVVAAHEWEHGPPWAPEELPWVPPPETYAYYDPYPWAWSGPAVGLGFGIRRGTWWGGYRGHYRGGWSGRGGFHRGFPGGFHGGGRRGRR